MDKAKSSFHIERGGGGGGYDDVETGELKFCVCAQGL